MTEAIYKIGDILEFTGVIPRQFGLRTGPVRGLVTKISNPGHEYLSYRLLVSGPMDDTKDMMIYWVIEKDVVSAAKRVGHIDISLLMFMENDEPDYAMFFTAATIAQAADLKNENEKLKAENKELIDALSKSEADNAMLKSQIACMEGRIESLIQKRDQLDADNRYLSAKAEHLIFNNDRKNGKIGSLQVNLAEETLKRKQAEAELNEKAEELDRICHSDIVCENNKLRNENTILNEIVNNFKSTCANCEARSENERLKEDIKKLICENERLSNENKNLKVMSDDLNMKTHKLEEDNGKLAQKISCADNLLAEAANRLYQGRAHLNITAHN